MKKDDEASPSIILASQALLVKMLITLKPRNGYVFGSNFGFFLFFFFIIFFVFFVLFFLLFLFFFYIFLYFILF